MSQRIVFSTIGSYGDLHPYMALALELQARGHRPVIATTDRYQEKIQNAGLEFHPVRPDASLFETDEREFYRKVMNSTNGPEYVIRGIMLPHLRDSYADTLAVARDADLLISHPLSYAVPIIAEQLQKRWMGTALQPSMFLSAYDPPILPQGQFLAPLYRRSRWLAHWLMQFARWMLRDWRKPIDDLRREVGLPLRLENPFFEGQYSPYANLALFSRCLGAPQPDWPAKTTVTGFAFYDRDEHDRGMPAELTAFLEDGPPPIVFTLGTSAVMVAGDFYRESFRAAQQLNRRAVFLIGKDERNQLGNLPGTMLAVDYAPYSELFPRAAAIVHQGGAGTTGQVLRAGKPCIVVPFSHDQPDHAARLNRLGMSETVNRHGYRAEVVARALKRILDNSSYAQKAARIGEQVRAEDGVRTACEIIERVGKEKIRS